MTLLVEPSPGILELNAYVPGPARAPGTATPVRLASNEAALGPSPLAVKAACEASLGMERYPDPGCDALRASIAERYGCRAGTIVCGTGSEALIHLIARCYLHPGAEAVIPAMAFAVYRIAALGCGARVASVPEKVDGALDVDAMLGRVSPETRVVFLANPNNPTGGLTSVTEIARLRRELPPHVLLVIDAAYRDYIDDPGYTAGLELVGEAEGNVVVLGTFSKSYGLAGMRVGWAYTSADIADVLNRSRPAFSVPLPAQAAAIAALGDRAHFDAEVAHVARWRRPLAEMLEAAGFEEIRVRANFAFARVPAPFPLAADLVQDLAIRGVLIRPMLSYGLKRHVRVTIGSDAEMHELRAALQAVADRRAA